MVFNIRDFVKSRPPIYLVSVGLMAIMGAASPLLSRYSYSFKSLPCNEKAESCDESLFSDYMALTWMKYILTTAVACICWSWDNSRYNKVMLGKSSQLPYFSGMKDIEFNREVPVSRWLLCGLAAIFDIGFSTTYRSAMLFTYAANVQLMSNFVVILCCFLKMLIPREALFVREWIAVSIITVGLCCSCIDSLTSSSVSSDTNWIGIVLAFTAAASKAVQVNIEHKLMRKYRYPPFKFMSISGCFSILYCIIISLVHQFTGSLDMSAGFWMVFNNPALLFVAVGSALTAGCFNLSSSVVQKFTSSVHREVFAMSAVILTWILELCFGMRTFEIITFFAEIVTCIGIICNSGIWSGYLPKGCDKYVTFGCLKVQQGLVMDQMDKGSLAQEEAYSDEDTSCDVDDVHSDMAAVNSIKN